MCGLVDACLTPDLWSEDRDEKKGRKASKYPREFARNHGR